MERYSRQLPLLGVERQNMLYGSSVTVVGCGGLGSHVAELLVRAGIGRIKVIDRDVVELSNLHRQTLFDEEDVRKGLPKAVVAAAKLSKINSEVKIKAVVADVTPGNALDLLKDSDLVVDGTDNFETRFVLNDACHKLGIPWIYGAVISTYGLVMPIKPDEGPCLRCLIEQPPEPGTLPTCEVVGVLNAAVAAIASLQVSEAIKALTGEANWSKLFFLDVWRGEFEASRVEKRDDCPLCSKGIYEFLGGRLTRAEVLCGRSAVMIRPRSNIKLNLKELYKKLSGSVTTKYNGFTLMVKEEGYEVILFPDGRGLIKGTNDPARAKEIYSRYISL